MSCHTKCGKSRRRSKSKRSLRLLSISSECVSFPPCNKSTRTADTVPLENNENTARHRGLGKSAHQVRVETKEMFFKCIESHFPIFEKHLIMVVDFIKRLLPREAESDARYLT